MNVNQKRFLRRSFLLAATYLLLFAGRAMGQTDFPIYTDSLVNGWQSWSWAKVNLADPSQTHNGHHSISVTGSGWQALYLHNNHFDTSTYSALSFWINGGKAGGQLLRVVGVLNGEEAKPFYELPALKANEWKQFVIPLGALGTAGAWDFDGVRIQDRSGKPLPMYYVADIKLTAAQPPAVVQIGVDANQVVQVADAGMFGINTAVYDANLDTPGTVDLLKEMGIQALRFPGGSTADGYHWAVGKSGTNSWEWATSFDKFAHMAAAAQAREVFITVNYGSGTASEAADWVKYSNVKQGYGFKYWEVGNENYGDWEIDKNSRPHDPATYAMRFKEYWTEMKAADPGIKIGAVAEVGEETDPTYKDQPVTNPRTKAIHNGWTPVMLARLKTLGVTPDFLIYHKYGDAAGDAGVMQMARTWPGDAMDLRGQLTDYLGAAGNAVELICTENNGPITTGRNPQSTSLVDGLYFADSLGAALQTEFKARIWWDLRNSRTPAALDETLYGWRPYSDDGMIFGEAAPADRYPTYYCCKLVSYFACGGDRIINASSDYSLLSAYASHRADGTLAILVINKTPNSVLNGEIKISGFTPGADATVYSYGIPQDTASRTGLGSPDIAQSNLRIASSCFTRAFPPYSATVIKLRSRASLSLAGFRSVDVMKYTKDVMTHQPGDERIDNLVSTLKTLNIDTIALAIPMDPSSDYPANGKPAPRDAYVLTQKWADAVHGQGLHVLWRGTWSGIEGISGFPKLVGKNRFPAGTADSAATDGASTWLGKTYHYVTDHPRFFEPGDIWAPLPERTEDIFRDDTSFLSHSGSDIQSQYVTFFTDLKRVSDLAFAKIGKAVLTGFTTNNYTEIKSGWLPQSFFDSQGLIVVDYYGANHTPEELDADLRAIHAMRKKPVVVQEWSDYWNGSLSPSERADYLKRIYGKLQKLADDGVVVGFNYWGGWDHTTESVISEDAAGFHLNGQGYLLQGFFKNCRQPAESR